MCEFVDDKASVFHFEELQRCMVDTLEEWEDYAPFRQSVRLPGMDWLRPVTPWRQRRMRGAGTAGGGRWQIQKLLVHQWKGMDFATQAEIHPQTHRKI